MSKPQYRRVGPLLSALALLAAACSGSDAQPPSTTNPKPPLTQEANQATSTSQGAPPLTNTVVLGPESGYSNVGGGYLGNPILASGPGNIALKSGDSLSIRFVARANATSVSASYIIKFDAERDGYNGGTVCRLLVSLNPDDGAGLPSETPIASTTIDDPCGGGRAGGWLTNEAWDSPAEVIGGQTYHLVFAQLDTNDENYVSINLLHRENEDPDELAFSTGNGQLALLSRGSSYWSGNDSGQWGTSEFLANHFPLFEIRYEDGSSQGISYVGARVGGEVVLSSENPARFRQSFEVIEDTTITSIHFSPEQKHTTPDSEVRLTLAAPDDVYLAQVDLSLKPGRKWFAGDFDRPIDLSAGDRLTVTVEGLAGEINLRPLYQAQHDDWVSTETSDWANTTLEVDPTGNGDWEPYFGEIPHDLSLYFTTEPPEPEEALADRPTVALLGDSLISGDTFEPQLVAALERRRIDLVSVTSVPGQNVGELDQALETNGSPTADYIIVASTINGEETGPEFEAEVRSVVDRVRSANPDSQILWVEAYALPIEYDYIVDDRVNPRNQVLTKLAAEGLFDLVPWASVAAANEWIFGSDGVHFFDNQQLYALTMVAAIEGEL